MEWVHIPEVTAEPLRFFGNPVMEALSRTKWWAVPLVWLPIALWALHKGIHALGGVGTGGGGVGAVGGGGVGQNRRGALASPKSANPQT